MQEDTRRVDVSCDEGDLRLKSTEELHLKPSGTKHAVGNTLPAKPVEWSCYTGRYSMGEVISGYCCTSHGDVVEERGVGFGEEVEG